MLTSFVAVSQTAPPWDFNNTLDNFVGSNFSNFNVGATYGTYNIVGPSDNPNLSNTDAMINTSLGNAIEITIQNNTLNTRLQVIIDRQAGGPAFTSIDGLTTNDMGFKTYIIDMSANAKWTGTVSDITFRFKLSPSGGISTGSVFVDNIAVVSTLSVNDFNNDAVAMFPNPVKDKLTVKSAVDINKIEVYSILGEKVLSNNLSNNTLNMESLSKGIYLLKLYQDNQVIGVKKVVKN